MDKRTTVMISEANWKHYERLKIQKISEGKGDLSFTRYTNAVLGLSNVTLDQVIGELRRKKEKP